MVYKNRGHYNSLASGVLSPVSWGIDIHYGDSVNHGFGKKVDKVGRPVKV